MLEEFLGEVVVADLRGPYVCLGTLVQVHEHYLLFHNADLHDLRDSDTGRENYIAASRMSGIKRNRKQLLVVRSEVVAITRFSDVVDD